MKKFKLILALAMMAMVMPCPAQSNMGIQKPTKKQVTTNYRFYELPGVKSNCTPVTPAGYEKVTKNGVTTFVEKKAKTIRKGGVLPPVDNNGIAVKCIFDCDMEAWQPTEIMAYNKTTGKEEYYDWVNNYVILKLDPGTYDFMAIYQKIDPTSMYWVSYEALVIKEGVQVSGETTLSFDPSTATNHISMRSYNPNGEQTRLRRIKYLDENYNYDILEEYNVLNEYMRKAVYHEDFGIAYSIQVGYPGVDVDLNPDCPQMGQMKSDEWLGDFYVNDVSDKYTFQQFRLMVTDDETYSTVIRAKCGETQTATNDYTKYNDPIQFKFVNSPSREKYNAESPYGGDFHISYYYLVNKERPDYWSNLASTSNAVHNIRFCPSSTVSELDNTMDFCYDFSYLDAVVNDTIDFGDGQLFITPIEYLVNGQTVIPQTDGNKYVFSQTNTWLESPQFGGPRYGLPGAEGLNFDFSNTDLVAGATCPIAVAQYYENEQAIGISAVYKGQMGEYRLADDLDATLELKADDKVVATNAEEMNAWINSGESHAPAKLTLSQTNCNFKVDGIEGSNNMVCVVDRNKDDHTLPSLTAMQFRGADGKVTNRFDRAEDATMAIMCGDFKDIIEDGNLWYDCGDCDVTVECAPNGTQDFTAIEMTKDDSKFFMPGYGAYYSANLGTITAESTNGWYDMRITVKDEAGNYQQQTFGPAFKIGNTQTGIGNVKVGNATEVARYTVDGRAISAPQAGVNIVKMSDGSVKKVWVK